jgi:hypothetical protein
VRHEEAWTRLPDLLKDRDDAGLLAHVRVCADCQRQLFLLGRVDRLLRDDAAANAASRKRRRLLRGPLAAAATVAAAAAILLALELPQHGRSEAFVLRTASGRSVAQALMGHADARNASLALTARGLPIDRGHMFVLWASDDSSSMQVGRFMVDQSGGCRVRFNLPTNHLWNHFWVTRLGNAAAVATSA